MVSYMYVQGGSGRYFCQARPLPIDSTTLHVRLLVYVCRAYRLRVINTTLYYKENDFKLEKNAYIMICQKYNFLTQE